MLPQEEAADPTRKTKMSSHRVLPAALSKTDTGSYCMKMSSLI